MQGNAVIVSVHNQPLTRYAAAQTRTEPVAETIILAATTSTGSTGWKQECVQSGKGANDFRFICYIR